MPDYKEQYYSNKRQEDSNQDFLGVVLNYDDALKELIIEQRNYFKKGDKVMIFEPNGDDYFMKIKYVKDETGNEIDVARHPKEIIRINCEKNKQIFNLVCQLLDWQKYKNIVSL